MCGGRLRSGMTAPPAAGEQDTRVRSDGYGHSEAAACHQQRRRGPPPGAALGAVNA